MRRTDQQAAGYQTRFATAAAAAKRALRFEVLARVLLDLSAKAADFLHELSSDVGSNDLHGGVFSDAVVKIDRLLELRQLALEKRSQASHPRLVGGKLDDRFEPGEVLARLRNRFLVRTKVLRSAGEQITPLARFRVLNGRELFLNFLEDFRAVLVRRPMPKSVRMFESVMWRVE